MATSSSSSATAVLQVQKLRPEAIVPTRGSEWSAGYDLSSAEAKSIPPGGRAVVKTALAIACPAGTYGRIAPRSGLTVKHGIHVEPGWWMPIIGVKWESSFISLENHVSMMSSASGWESVKENAAPLERGRSVSALEHAAAITLGFGSALQTKSDESEKRIEEFERSIRPSEAPHVTETQDDPLVRWMAYIKYCQDYLPSDTHQQFLLMERCTRALVKMPQYADDDRFISVCAKYADKTKEPGQVFKYLHRQKVGQRTALFWVAWAFVAEKSGDFPFAEHIYKKGICKDAQPLNMLKIRHKQFQRRMSRYWLNSSQQNDQLEEADDGEAESNLGSRGALGGLSHDRVRLNDRSRAAPQLSQRPRVANRRAATSSGAWVSNTSNTAAKGSMSIFVESAGADGPTKFLDRPLVESKRVIERDSDRHKENTLEAERWNERGGLASSSSSGGFLSRSSHSRTAGRGAPPPFAVFVDEECVAQHGNEESAKQNQAERNRACRDERTFRERKDEGLVERLTRDPLRYVRDPTQFESDIATTSKGQEEGATNRRMAEPERSNKRAYVGFNKKLLKNGQGAEQSFEEARGVSMCYAIAPSTVNFNLMQRNNVDQSSLMDLDEEVSHDVSMDGSSMSGTLTKEEQPRKVSRLESKSEGTVLFPSERTSKNTSLNQTAISNASSAVHESDAVGVPTRKEEETINTKLALRELSMMFSSPAFGVDNLASKTERRMKYNSIFEDARGSDSSYADVADTLVGHSMLDNSILNYDNENRGPRNPLARTASTPGLDSKALREISSESDVDETALGCARRTARYSFQTSQQDSLRGERTESDETKDFQIFEDENTGPVVAGSGIPTASARTEGPDVNLRILQDVIEQDKEPVAVSFAIYQDTGEDNECNITERGEADTYAQGDTATFSLLGDVLCSGEMNQIVDESLGRASSVGVSEQGDTATYSIFNDVFQGKSEAGDLSQALCAVSSAATSGGFSIFVDEEAGTSNKLIRESTDYTANNAVDYISSHEHCTKMALRRLQASSSVASDSRSPLLALLSLRGQSFHLPHITLPREFRSKHISGNTRVQIGKHSGVMCRELGRGAYGVVVLMDLQGDSGDGHDTIAVKAQAPIGCLAWECEILRRLEGRMDEQVGTSIFPKPLSFISLADGGILSMTAGSRTGFNLVDLANIYKLKLGEHVPEIDTLHYVSRMLRHLEQLHWYGKIIHCDVKPDNFVVSSNYCADNSHRDIEFSDVMLVDFGRALDLKDFALGDKDARSVVFLGESCRLDSQCVAMRAGQSWSYDIDTFGVLACAHVLLWGTHIELRKGKNDRWYLVNAFKRYWQKELWTSIFDTLLNLDAESGGAIGSHARSLRSLRTEIENYTETESEKLRSFLTRQLSLLPSSRDQLK